MRRRFPVLLLGACAPELAAVEAPDPSEQFIYLGSPPDAPHHDATVALFDIYADQLYAQPYCSGTLIAPDAVLTAAHCLDVASQGAGAFQTVPPDEVVVYVGDDPSLDRWEHVYPVLTTAIHPAYDRLTLEHDLAVLRLAVSVTEVAPVPALPPALRLRPADLGALGNYAGFGDTETGGYGVKLQVDVPFGGAGCSVAGCPDPGFPATTFSYSMAQGGPCFGDSGGPTFLERQGTWYVAGVTSYGDAGCTVYGVQTKVDAYSAALANYLASAPTAPNAPGAGVCGDGTCNPGETCDGRSGTTSCATDCPGVAGGPNRDRFCTAGPACVGEGC